jgi:hypothetical protein
VLKDELEIKVFLDKLDSQVIVVWLDLSVNLVDEVRLVLWADLVLMDDLVQWDLKDQLALWDPQELMV